jgi:hypothetical protein
MLAFATDVLAREPCEHRADEEDGVNRRHDEPPLVPPSTTKRNRSVKPSSRASDGSRSARDLGEQRTDELQAFRLSDAERMETNDKFASVRAPIS